MHLQRLFVCIFAQDDRHYQVPFQELMVRISYTQMILYTFLLYIRFRNICFLYYLSFCLCKSLQRTLVVLRFLTHCGMFKTFWPNSFVFESECKGTHFLLIYQMFLNVFWKTMDFSLLLDGISVFMVVNHVDTLLYKEGKQGVRDWHSEHGGKRGEETICGRHR